MLKKGIKTKLILSLVVFTLLVMSIFFIILDRYLKDYSINETEKTIFFLGQNASSLLQKPLFDADYHQLENIARPLILADFDYLVIFDNITQNIAFKEEKTTIGIIDSLRLEEMLKNQIAFEKESLYLNGEHYTQYLFPVISIGVSRPLGYLIIGTSVERMQSKLEGITRRILLISTLLFLTLTLTIYFLSDKIVKPIKILSEKIETFASGDYSVRSDIKNNDEIQVLSDNFNIMADKINEQILSIEGYSKNLEKMVEERTRELLAALDAIKEKDKKLNQAEKINSLNSIVSSIAHEINNPLAIISGNLQMLEIKVNKPGIKKKLEAAEEAIQRIAKLIDEINFFFAIKDISISPLSFSNLLSTVVSKVVPENISIIIDEGQDDRINSNANLLNVCMENIIKNSVEVIQARDIQGKIHVRYFKDRPFFTVEIIDNAGGVEEPEKVFDPFYTTFMQKKGLGLTFVYHAIQAMNGEVTIENVENGAKVSIMLPLEEPGDVPG
ncbi:MAG: HAMP domain-containing protein [Candidatus Aminicenantes bacterium]|nr:MAG: HAMP domain-containing protein [Candidatus Aminicenantes bacterium]